MTTLISRSWQAPCDDLGMRTIKLAIAAAAVSGLAGCGYWDEPQPAKVVYLDKSYVFAEEWQSDMSLSEDDVYVDGDGRFREKKTGRLVKRAKQSYGEALDIKGQHHRKKGWNQHKWE